MAASSFLDVAHQIGRRLVRDAIWDGSRVCSWEVTTYNRDPSGNVNVISETADGTVYRGAAGIVLFLSELFRHTRDKDLQPVIHGATRYALSKAKKINKKIISFYGGRSGVAYVATKVGRQFDRQDYVQDALDLLPTPDDAEEQNWKLDVISGAASAIPALLQLAGWTGAARPGRLAFKLGEFLIQEAFREPTGWSWKTRLAPRNLTGYSHGASGIGHALLELYCSTGAKRYRYAAEQAFLYERQFFDERKRNWADLRYGDLLKRLQRGRDTLRDALENDFLPPPQKDYPSTWCHGATGIGFTRLRAYELSRSEVHANEAQAALQSAQEFLDPSWNYSLCHGIAGNCDLLLYGESVLGESALREEARRWGERGTVYLEDENPWSTGTAGDSSSPSLMIGEAGVGYFYLRLFSTDTPSCLLLRSPKSLNIPTPEFDGYPSLQRNYVASYFGRTLEVTTAHEEKNPPTPERPIEGSLHCSDVESFSKRMGDWLSGLSEPTASLLKDATRLDRTRYKLQQEIDDFTEELIGSIRRPDLAEISWDENSFALASHTQLVSQKWDWDGWLSLPAPERPDVPDKSRSAYLLYRKNNKIQIRELGSLAELVLRSLETRSSLSQIERKIRKHENLDGSRSAILRRKIVEQLQQLYKVSAIKVVQPEEV